MMKKFTAILLALVLTVFASLALAESEICVNGKGEVYVPADKAFVSVGVQLAMQNVQEAQKNVNERVNTIRAKLLEAGIDGDDINTDNINIYAYTDFDDAGNEKTLYHVSSMLTVRVTDTDRTGEVIDIAFAAGANVLNGVTFTATETAEAEKEAMQLAVKNAREKAEILAEAAGLKITGVDKITEGYSGSFDSGLNVFDRVAAKEEAASYGATEIHAAKILVSAEVTINYDAKEPAE